MIEEDLAKCLWWCSHSLGKDPDGEKKFSREQNMAAHMIASFVYEHPDTKHTCCHKDALEMFDWSNLPSSLEEWIYEVKQIVKFYS